jgi:hypothetical protein
MDRRPIRTLPFNHHLPEKMEELSTTVANKKGNKH